MAPLKVEIRFKVEGLQDIQRSVADQGSEMGARCIPAVATPRDDPLVGVQTLFCLPRSSKNSSTCTPTRWRLSSSSPPPPSTVWDKFRCLAFQPFSGLSPSQVHLRSGTLVPLTRSRVRLLISFWTKFTLRSSFLSGIKPAWIRRTVAWASNSFPVERQTGWVCLGQPWSYSPPHPWMFMQLLRSGLFALLLELILYLAAAMYLMRIFIPLSPGSGLYSHRSFAT
jgi:hypothetical protein